MSVDSGNKTRVLIVDDDPGVHALVSALLERANMEMISAFTAGDAAKALRARPLPEIIVLDLMLPDVSGVELLRQMRTKEVFDHIPVVILSALADPDQIREGLNAGADRYLTKPYLANNLVTVLQETLRTGRKK